MYDGLLKRRRKVWKGKGTGGGFTDKRDIVRIVALDERGQRLLRAEDGAAEIGLLDAFIQDADAQDGVGVWDAVRDYCCWVRGV